MSKEYFSVLFASCLLLIGCARQSVNLEAEAEELMRISREWSDVTAAGEIDSTLSYWADDAVLMAPGQPAIRGKAAIRDYLTASAEIPGLRVSWKPLEAHVSESGDLQQINRKAAGSLREGWEETLTLHRLGLFEELGRGLKITGCIENLNGQVERYLGKVKRWHHSPQRHRWMALGLLEVEQRMRRIDNYPANKTQKCSTEVHRTAPAEGRKRTLV